jgi:hypothetical protein
MQQVVTRISVGLGLTVLLVGAAIGMTWQWGPTFGVWDWKATGAGLLFIGAMAVLLLAEFFRTPNPYSRIYHLYDLRDVSPDRNVQSGSERLIWQAAPLVLTAAALLVW